MELSEEQLVVIAKGLRDKKPESGWEGVYDHVKKSSLFKGWKVPDSKIKYIAEVIKIYEYNIPSTYDSLLGSDGFKGFENYAPKSSESKTTKDSNSTSVKPSKSGSGKPKLSLYNSVNMASRYRSHLIGVQDY